MTYKLHEPIAEAEIQQEKLRLQYARQIGPLLQAAMDKNPETKEIKVAVDPHDGSVILVDGCCFFAEGTKVIVVKTGEYCL